MFVVLPWLNVGKASANLVILLHDGSTPKIKARMRKILVILMLVALCSFESDIKLVRTKISEEITVLLPREFRPMDELDFSQRYPSVRKPIAAFTNEDRIIDFSVNVSATQWPDGNAEMAQKFFKASLLNTFDGVDMIDEGVHEVHGRKFIFFEFESRIRGEARSLSLQDAVLNYTYIQYLVEPNRTLVFSFNCPRRLRMDWQEAARKMMTSVKMKQTHR
jgi:hypothetical protein